MSENRTLDYYNKNASSFAETTIDVDFQETQKRFQKLLPMQGYILDFGCGSGRDTKYFLSQNFLVDAIDGSEKLCRIASDYTGIKVKRDGIIYTSFKYGDFEGERNGRYFIDFTEEKFNKFILNVENVKLKEEWITCDVRPGRGEEKWLNLILQKN